MLHRFVEQISNMIPKQVDHTPFKFQNESSMNHRIRELKHSFVKWQDHVYDFEIMI